MIESNDILSALQELYNRVGTQKAMAELAEITQSTINAYLSGKAKVENMPMGVFMKLFRDAKIDFFGETTGDSTADMLRKEMIEIFDQLDNPQKLKAIAMLAANFGEQLRKETKK